MNNWNFTGNIGKTGEIRYTAGSNPTPVLGFSVAVTSGYGENAKTTWANCQLFGKRAESLAPYVVKGASVAVSGEVTLREWESQGKKGQSLDVRVSDLTLTGGKPGASDAPAKNNAPKDKETAKTGNFDDFDDDIPF